MSNLSWYWHRLRAMTPLELALHGRKKWRQFVDARVRPHRAKVTWAISGAFPKLPKPEDAPEELRAALKRDVEDILAGRWRAFGHLEIKVDDPPRWHCDYLVGRDLATNESAFKLNHRVLPDGADIKLIWELSRWHQLVRLAMAADLLGDARAGEKCIEWLEDWVNHNPPYLGWNWTSALEVGLRLIQFTWIDALLSRSSRPVLLSGTAEGGREEAQTSAQKQASPPTAIPATEARLGALRDAILPAHAQFAWRHRSFGSSANNHLLGELVGLIVATVRWPGLEKRGATLDDLTARWEREVLAQFAEDGGNKEQALNYHLFSWEFCWQAQAALQAAGRAISPPVAARLEAAAEFFGTVQVEREAWDYGDSDNAFVTPFFAHAETATTEWWNWMCGLAGGAAVEFWCGKPPRWPIREGRNLDWNGSGYFPESGMVLARVNLWTVRWDVSPLGYLATAAHGHLDALHVSIWFKGVAIIVDPGTGAYYGDRRLRDWLASRAAHNGPCLEGVDSPKRLGPFLWSEHHAKPSCDGGGPVPAGMEWSAGVIFRGCQIRRLLKHCADKLEWQVEDWCAAPDGTGAGFSVRWLFAPGSLVKKQSERLFSVERAGVVVEIEVDGPWATVELIQPGPRDEVTGIVSASVEPMEGKVSSAFRMVGWSSLLKLTARASAKPGRFRTLFRVPGGSAAVGPVRGVGPDEAKK